MKRKLFLIPLLLLVGCSISTLPSEKGSSLNSTSNLATSVNKDSNIQTSSVEQNTSNTESLISSFTSSQSETSSLSSNSSLNSSSSSSQETQEEDIKKVLDLARNEQLKKEVSYKITSFKVDEKLAYDEYVTKNESILSVSEYENGLIRNEVNKIYHDDTVAYSYIGEGKVSLHNDQYIDYMKYDVDRNEVVTAKVDYIKTITPTNLKEYLICDVTTQIQNNLTLLNEKFVKETNQGNTTYSLNCIKIEEQAKKEEYNISFNVNSNQQITSYNYEKKTYTYDWLNEEFKTTYGLIKTTYEINYGTITSETISVDDVCVNDVSLKLYDINDSNQTALDLNNIKINTSIDVMVTNFAPSTALDTHFYIASSSNENVIAKMSYGVYKVIGVGATTLTIKNELGFTKLVEVTTFAPSLESIDFQVSSTNLYVGNDYLISLILTPSDAVSEVEFTSSNEAVIEVIKKENKYYLSCKTLGTAEITVKSKTNPSITKTKSFEVKETTLKQFLLDNIFKGYDYNTFAEIRIEFINSFQGKICFEEDEKQFTYSINANVIKFSTFDYCGTTYTTNKITLSDDLLSASLSCVDEFYFSSIETSLEIIAK